MSDQFILNLFDIDICRVYTVNKGNWCTMKKILFINACVRHNSRTYLLAQGILSKLNGQIIELKLFEENLQPLNCDELNRRNDYIAANDFTEPIFKYAKQFADADIIVIAAPYWDLSFPSAVKVYFEHVTVTGITFKYSPQGDPVGLCNAQRIIYVTTAGGAINEFNLGYDYIKALANTCYGIHDIVCYKAQNLDIIGADKGLILRLALETINNEVH